MNRININDEVEVDLTPYGRLTLYKYEISIGTPVHTTSHMTGKRLKIQFWELMHVFGPEMVIGRDPCFESNVIRVPTESLRPDA